MSGATWIGPRRAVRPRLCLGAKLDGVIEADETFVGGKTRNMHKHIREQEITGTGGKDKTVVAGIMERGGKMRATVVSRMRRDTLQAGIRENVEPGAGSPMRG
jgi:hypothetical protein